MTEPIAYFDFQERGFYWANNVAHGPVPVSVKVDPMPLYTHPEPLTNAGLIIEKLTNELNRKDAVLRMALEALETLGLGKHTREAAIAAIKSCTENGEKLTGDAGRVNQQLTTGALPGAAQVPSTPAKGNT